MTNFEVWKEKLKAKEAANMLHKTIGCTCRGCPISPKGTFRPCNRIVKEIENEDYCDAILEKWFKQEGKK